jgi:peptidoglycan-associated lipoprotein
MRTPLLSLVVATFVLAACADDSNLNSAGDGAGDGSANAGSTIKRKADGSIDYPDGSKEEFANEIGDRVFFGYDQYGLQSEGRATLTEQAQWLKKYPNFAIVVEGHCDERGTREYNLALGERRSNAVKSFLVSQGVPSSRVKTISYGKEKPAVSGANDASWAQNRRGVTVVE